MLKFFGSSAKAPPQDDPLHHDDLRSETSTPTPPGAQTPHPDLLDKRTPGLFSSYFGQVRNPSTTTTSVTSQSTSTLSSMAQHEQETASSSRPHKHSVSSSEETSHPKHVMQNGYPTPPVSSSPTPVPQPSSTKDSKKSKVSPKSLRTHTLLSSRRNTLTTDPLMGIANTQPVHASHLSKPGLNVSRCKTSSPITPRHSISKPPPNSSSAPAVHQALTKTATQATPPRTPRSHSSTTASRTQSPSTQTSPSRPEDGAKRRRKDSLRKAVSGETKGRLSITISAGRGLKPSVDPYVVCSFQWNEYISKGPQSESNTDDGHSTSPRRSMPIKRTASDIAGKPMAIPMRSRQSSHTSMSSQTENPTKGQEVTDPVWDHEALL